MNSITVLAKVVASDFILCLREKYDQRSRMINGSRSNFLLDSVGIFTTSPMVVVLGLICAVGALACGARRARGLALRLLARCFSHIPLAQFPQGNYQSGGIVSAHFCKNCLSSRWEGKKKKKKSGQIASVRTNLFTLQLSRAIILIPYAFCPLLPRVISKSYPLR
jgi:hypothetical protein